LKLAPLVFVRPGELRHAKWGDIDLKEGEWLLEPVYDFWTRSAAVIKADICSFSMGR
jgi:hypothetical protein